MKHLPNSQSCDHPHAHLLDHRKKQDGPGQVTARLLGCGSDNPVYGGPTDHHDGGPMLIGGVKLTSVPSNTLSHP